MDDLTLIKVGCGVAGLASIYVLVWFKRADPAVYIQLVTAALTALGVLAGGMTGQ